MTMNTLGCYEFPSTGPVLVKAIPLITDSGHSILAQFCVILHNCKCIPQQSESVKHVTVYMDV